MVLRPSRRIVLLGFAGICLLFASPSSTTPSAATAPSAKGPKVHRVVSPKVKQYSHHGSHHVAAAFYDTRGRWRSTLTLNNKGPQEKRPRVTLVSHDGRRSTIPNVSVPGTGFVDIDLNAAAAAAGPGFEFGSLRMTYYGDIFEMGAQVLVADLGRGIQFDEQLSYASTTESLTRQGVWWLPAPEASLTLVLTNLSDETIVVQGQLRGTASTPLDTVSLEPQSLRVVALPRARQPGASAMGAVSLTYDGPPGALLARGFIEAGRTGYSAPVEFADPAGFRTSSLHGGGVRLSGPDGRPVSPVVVATNGGTVSTTVMGALVTTSPDGEVLRFSLPARTLSPGETALLDSALAEAGAREASQGIPAGLEVDYTSPPGSVLVTAASVSADLNYVFRVPLIDPETPKSSTGGYPWRADGQTATVVYLKNTTSEPQNYVLQLTFAGGVYAPGLKTLKPGETLTLDIKALRDAQVPDAFGHMIPREATGGQVHWSAKGRTRHAIIGRAEHVDHDHGVSASYACINCCPDNPYEWWTEGDPIVIPIGDWVDVYIYIRDIDCYNNLLAPYYLGGWHGQDWWISDTNVAVGDNNATITGVDGGSTTFNFTYHAEYWYPDVYEFGWFCNYVPNPLPYQTPVKIQRPTYVAILGEPQYTQGPPAPYVYNVNRIILDQDRAPLYKRMFVTESFSPDPPEGDPPTPNCSSGEIIKNNDWSNDGGTFPDLFYLPGEAPNPCRSISTQSFSVRLNDFNYPIQTKYLVNWFYSGVVLACTQGCVEIAW
jgi:hypothetical protein